MKKNPLDQIMGTDEAAIQWGLSQDHIKKLCRNGKCKARLVGKTWILLKDQPNPASRSGDNSNQGESKT